VNPSRPDRRLLVAIVLVATGATGVIALTNGGSGDRPASAATAAGGDDTAATIGDGSIVLAGDTDLAAPATTAAPADPNAATTVPAADGENDLVGEETATGDGCTMEPKSLRIGATGASVSCLQDALTKAGFYTGPVNGTYDQATASAVEKLQTDRNLYVDGVAGRESGKSLGIWPDEQLFVVHTPKPPPGAVDLLGYPLSSVASAGDDAPPLPANSGSGKRLVYERLSQRVWAVDGEGRIVRSWLVAGSQYNNEMPGVHEVYSKSEQSTAWNGKAILPKMVRWLKTQKGAIGFHGIPIHVEDGSPYMTEAELGQRLSGGCQRQADLDADFTWDFADIGTTVVVL
jgi:peptidoglycan hydrolase-like protein with peptidoglycan-binding domain